MFLALCLREACRLGHAGQGTIMVSRVRTVAFQGIEAVAVDVQVMIAPGKKNIHIVGLPDKAVAESRERVQAALHASGLSMPPRKVTVNLAPADLPKEGSHLSQKENEYQLIKGKSKGSLTGCSLKAPMGSVGVEARQWYQSHWSSKRSN